MILCDDLSRIVGKKWIEIIIINVDFNEMKDHFIIGTIKETN
jgi:hypothetical protein